MTIRLMLPSTYGGRPRLNAATRQLPLTDQCRRSINVGETVESSDGIDPSIVGKLGAEGFVEKYKSNKWIGRVGL